MAKKVTKKVNNTNELDGKEFFAAIAQIEQEKGIKPGYMMEKITQALLSAIPEPETGRKIQRTILRGEISSPINPKDECRFAKRCPFCSEKCTAQDIPLKEVSPDHFVACILAQDEL